MLFVEGRVLSKLTVREILFRVSYCNDYYTISSDLNIGIIKLHLALPAPAPDTQIARYRDTEIQRYQGYKLPIGFICHNQQPVERRVQIVEYSTTNNTTTCSEIIDLKIATLLLILTAISM